MLIKHALVCVACLFCCARAAGAVDGIELLHYEILRDYAKSRVVAPGDTSLDSPLELSFDAFGRSFELELQPNARLLGVARRLGLAPGIAAYRGTLRGEPRSWLRIVTTANGPTGLIWDGENLYGLEAPFDSAASSADPVIFRLDDLYIAPATMTCGATEPPDTAEQAFALIVGEFRAMAAQGAAVNLDVGAVADFEFTNRFGTDAEAAVLARLNNVDGIFSAQIGVQITAAELDLFTTADDPFSENDAEDLLDELAVYRGATPAQDAQGLSYLFTGRNLDGATAGIAFVGAVCARRSRFDPLGRSFAVGLSEGGRRGLIVESLIAAHEIGHSFGAPHDAESGSPCASTPPTFIMARSVSFSNQEFSACSIEQMQPEIESASCLAPIGQADLSVAVAEPNRTVLAGATFSYTVTISNLGLDPATGIVLSATLDPGLELLDADSQSGSCSASVGVADCVMADLPGGAAADATLTLRAAGVGAFGVDTEVGADQDADPADNQLNDLINVLPAVDLVVAAGAIALRANESATLTATLRNESDFAASAVSLTIDLSAGLRPADATLAAVDCTIEGQRVTCPGQSLAARTTATLTLSVTALASGAQQISIEAVAAEAEREPSDNDLLLDLNVTAAASDGAGGSSGGGGGAVSWLWLTLTCPIIIARHRRRAQSRRTIIRACGRHGP
jgi:uncharacterized repeat protein (TIGR01451 family)